MESVQEESTEGEVQTGVTNTNNTESATAEKTLETKSVDDIPQNDCKQGSTEVVPEVEASSTLPTSLPGYLPWEDDMEMVSKYLDRKEDLEDSHQQYLLNNPELKAILADFLQAVLIQKPDNIYKFAQDFFLPFAPKATHQASFPSHKVPEQSN